MELFVGNIPYDYTKSDIEELFSPCGDITSVRMMMDPKTDKFRGFAFVRMKNDAGREQALAYHHKMIKAKTAPIEEEDRIHGASGYPYGSIFGRRKRSFERKLLVLPARNNNRRFRAKKKVVGR